jgi:ribosomal protein S18 acetylase RimI-like enzyme
MIEYRIATAGDIDLMMSSRLEMLHVVNDLNGDYEFTDDLINYSREYFLNGDQTTVLALDGQTVIGCASMSYMTIMPTFSHPTGKRAHLMNVYTNSKYRRQGIARTLLTEFLRLIPDETENIALEVRQSNSAAIALYEQFGFEKKGVRKRFYRSPVEDADVMVKNISR